MNDYSHFLNTKLYGLTPLELDRDFKKPFRSKIITSTFEKDHDAFKFKSFEDNDRLVAVPCTTQYKLNNAK